MNPHQPAFKHSPEGVTYQAECIAPDCHYIVFSGGRTDEFYARLFRDHAKQYEPGRAPDIDIDWVIDASCSVCEWGGDVQMVDGEWVRCFECGTSWGMDGTGGERDAP